MISSVITLKDNYTNVARRVGRSAENMRKELSNTERKTNSLTSSLKKMTNRKYDVKIRSVGDKRIRDDLRRLQSQIRKTTGKDYKVRITAQRSWKEMLSGGLSFLKNKTIHIKTNVTGLIRARIEAQRLSRELYKATGRRHRVSIGGNSGAGFMRTIAGQAGNAAISSAGAGSSAAGAAGAVGSAGGLAVSAGAIGAAVAGVVAALAALGLAIGGFVKLTKSMIDEGSALQQQEVAMTHFLGGDEAKSASYTKELRENANLTPFSTAEVVAAGTRAVQITEGDTKKGMEFVKLAEDMAALMPGKTISDAMEALADAQMGEMERLKEFGFKGSKELFDEAQGDLFKMKSMTGRSLLEMFEGGARKKSETWDGKISTIKGNIQTGLADSGKKIIDALLPALDKLIPVSVELAKRLPEITEAVIRYVTPHIKTAASVIKNDVVPTFKFLGGVVMSIASAIQSATATISSVKNTVSGWFGGKAEKSGAVKSIRNYSGRGFATGTMNFSGGWARVNERGDEMFQLPTGTKIYPSSKTDAAISKELRLEARKKSSPNINMTFNIQTGGSIDERMIGKMVAKEIEKVLVNLN